MQLLHCLSVRYGYLWSFVHWWDSYDQDVTYNWCPSQFVHYVYNRFEPQPINLLPTLLLLVFIPLLPAALLVSQSAARSSVVVKLQRALLPCLGFYATLITSIIIYRISPFHPLADVPGPSLARLSQALWASTTLGKHRHKYYKKLHERYGPYVRVGALCIPLWLPHITY